MALLRYPRRPLWRCLNTMTNKPISFYFHIPFCVKKCDYCAFYSLAEQTEEIKERYFQALLKQLALFPADRAVKTVYFGGGTPPMLGINRLCQLIEAIKGRFVLEEDCEITVEVNPGTVDYYSLLALRNAGANRLSIGIQSANDRVLKELGRIHSFSQGKACVAWAREAGFDNISVDIMFALPYQSDSEFSESLNLIMSTEPDHISAYSLQLEEGTPLYRKRSELTFPDEESEEAQYDLLCKILNKRGFEHYEISSFAKNGKRSKHNLNYWGRGEYFGFGAGAHSHCFGKRFSAVCDIDDYIAGASLSLLGPTDFDDAEPITPEEAEEERIMLGLRTCEGVLLPESAFEAAEGIAKLGYGRFENGILALNSRGFRVSNSIISEILT